MKWILLYYFFKVFSSSTYPWISEVPVGNPFIGLRENLNADERSCAGVLCVLGDSSKYRVVCLNC